VAGATRVALKIRAPRRLRYSVVVTESGAEEREAASFAGARGADGEQYYRELRGAGKAREEVLDLSRFRFSTTYGNQKGNRRLDTQAILRVELVVPGGQGPGQIEIHSIRFL
jgi:hypothetical protein